VPLCFKWSGLTTASAWRKNRQSAGVTWDEITQKQPEVTEDWEEDESVPGKMGIHINESGGSVRGFCVIKNGEIGHRRGAGASRYFCRG